MPPSITDAHNRAQILYRKGDYLAAIKALTAILTKWPEGTSPPLTVLDTRAAAFIKLKNYTEALLDARAMITSDKTISSGYLRAGQVLRKQGLDRKAVRVYELALKEVFDSAALAIVRKELLETKKGITPDGARDWIMTVLPAEILELVIQKLEFREFVRLQLVCRKWRDILRSIPRLWRELDFGSKKVVKHKTLEAYGTRAQWKVTKLVLRRTATGTMRMMVNKCRSLQTICYHDPVDSNTQDFLSLFTVSKSLQYLSVPAFSTTIQDALACMHAIRQLKGFAGFVYSKSSLADGPNFRIPVGLETLALGTSPEPLFGVERLFIDAVNLIHLRIDGIHLQTLDLRHMQQLRSLRIHELVYEQAIHFPSNLEILEIDGIRRPATSPLIAEGECTISSLPKLRQLKVGGSIVPNKIDELLAQCGPTLESLEMGNAIGPPWSVFMDKVLKKDFGRLEYLSLGSNYLEDDTMGTIGHNCPQLRRASIANNPMITGSGVARLVESATKLDTLALSGCLQVRLDVIGWARNRGIKVRFEPFVP